MAEDQKEKLQVKKVAIQKENYLAIFYEFHQVCVSFFIVYLEGFKVVYYDLVKFFELHEDSY